MSKYNNCVSKLLSTVFPEYKQACRDVVLQLKKDLKLEKVEDLIEVPLDHIKSRQPDLLRQYNYSIAKSTEISRSE